MKAVLTVLVSTGLVLAQGVGTTAHAQENQDIRTSHQELAWTGENAQAERTALSVGVGSRARPTVATQRILLHDGKRRLITTWSLDHSTGIKTLHLLDDHTGWWLQIRLKLGVHTFPGEEYPVFTQRFEEWLKPGQGHEIEFQVTTSTGYKAERQFAVGPDFADLMRDLAQSLEEDASWQAVKLRIPPEVLVSAKGWQEPLHHYESLVRLVITFLDEVAGAQGGEPSPLTISRTQIRSGIEPDSPSWQELLRTFEHFDPDDPFPEDIFASADSP